MTPGIGPENWTKMRSEYDHDTVLRDLVTAYRKAKVDLYYDDNPRRLELVQYEEDLAQNLHRLREQLAGDDESWVRCRDFTGGFTFVPKSLREPESVRRSFWSVPAKSWRGHWDGNEDNRPTAEFRLMATCSIDFHVLSTLWMLHVGTFLDMNLSSSARGSRLQYLDFGSIDHLSTGSFKNYRSAYRSWRNDGLRRMREGLDSGSEIIAMTADVTAFYHRLDVSFLLNEQFLDDALSLELGPWQRKLHRLFVDALQSWAAFVAEEIDWHGGCGLPVGLPASAVVANLALRELDNVMDEMDPLFYGRYVDDILLVVEDEGDTPNQAAFLRKLSKRTGGLLILGSTDPASDEHGLRYVPDYLTASKVVFANDKNKTFHLAAPSGYAVIDAIKSNIEERNSEWRALAVVPPSLAEIEPSIAQARRSDGDPALNLRDADEISARKQSFSIRIRDFEGFERNLGPGAWEAERKEFFHAVREHVLSLPSLFELANYLPRIFALGAACSDAKVLLPTFAVLPTLPKEVRDTCDIKVSDIPIDERRRNLVLDRWATYLADQAIDGLARGWVGPMTGSILRETRELLTPLKPRHAEILSKVSAVGDAHVRLAQRDLAHRPYRWGVLGFAKGEQVPAASRRKAPLHPVIREGLNALARALPNWRGPVLGNFRHGSHDAGLAFATRPPSMMELYRVLAPHAPNGYGIADWTLVDKVLKAFRGYGHPRTMLENRKDLPSVIHVPMDRRRSPVRIALVMMETNEQDTIESAKGSGASLTGERYNAIRALLESVRKGVDDGAHLPPNKKRDRRPDYVLLPELSIPESWFDEFALGLMRSGISLIAGIEHQPRPSSGISNQVWAALRTNNLTTDYFLYRQDKQNPAYPERPILTETKTTWTPEFRWSNPPVIEHGGFRFGLLICSEFTNINYRAHLRGGVDALFVPEWNQDLHSFEALVEASALDLHAYIAQANTRGYGDTRLRAPSKEEWGRDVVRLRGGEHDYFVVGEMDYDGLRAFQNAPPTTPPQNKPKRLTTFKPTPDGFVPDPARAT
ncbi:hypothetical protein H1W00_08045 [Aeromicrobium sp. Marseille-Q0843]|uniref:Reverse transcriptase domain-containing protein n=1 Tax=Aeromicrobium phoceense TaxID=2754045 RepID=A0A838XN68_9ACTN|nr:hypothetical protein [Aeromicrobium phoceense]MBA4608424.1 hypothetical protein [Aeromicrobium phoceense]